MVDRDDDGDAGGWLTPGKIQLIMDLCLAGIIIWGGSQIGWDVLQNIFYRLLENPMFFLEN